MGRGAAATEDNSAVQRRLVLECRRGVSQPAVFQALKRLATNAAQPVRWGVAPAGDSIVERWEVMSGEITSPVIARRPKGARGSWGISAFIANFDPVMVLAILEEMENLLAIIQEWTTDPEDCQACAAMGIEPCPYHRGVGDGEAHMARRLREMLDG